MICVFWHYCTEAELRSRIRTEELKDEQEITTLLMMCCHCSDEGRRELTESVRGATLHRLWLPDLLDVIGVNKDADALLIQAAYVKFYVSHLTGSSTTV